MMKKWLAIICMVTFIGWAGYRFFFTRDISKTKPVNSMALDWDQLDATTGTPVGETPQTIKANPRAETPDLKKETPLELTPEEKKAKIEKDEQFAEFEIVEQRWLSKVHMILGPKHYQYYMMLKERNEKEKLVAYKAYHEYLKRKFGDKYSYNISEDQNIAEKRVNQRYLQDLLRVIGEKKFQEYVKARDDVNEESRRNDKEYLQIEF